MKHFKKTLCVLLAAVSAIGLFGCAKDGNVTGGLQDDGDYLRLDMPAADESVLGTDKQIEITFSGPITGADSPFLQDIVYLFNKKYKGKIKVTMQMLTEANHYTKLIASKATNDMPDVAIVHTERLAQFYNMGALTELTDYCAQQSVKKEDYEEIAWNNGVFNDKLYAVPYDLIPVVLYYNKDLIPEGYTESDITEGLTFEKMCDLMKAATDKTAGQEKKYKYGWAFNYAQTSFYFCNWLAQAGEFIVNDAQPTEPTFDTETGHTIAQNIRELVDEGVVTKSGVNHFSVFQQGRALFVIDGVWQMDLAEKAEMNYGITGMPIMYGDTSKVLTRSHCLTMMNNKNSTEETRKASMFFIRFLVERSLHWMQSGKMSVRKDVSALKEYKALKVSAVDTQLITVPRVNTYGIILDKLNEHLALLYEGEETTAVALSKAAEEAKTLAEEAQKAD